MSHTPGPWTLLPEEADKDYLRIRGTRLGGRYKVANVHHLRFKGVHAVVRERDYAESMANARLIAAAPELLEKLNLMTSLVRLKYGNLDADVWREIQETEALIQRATGVHP